MVTRQEQFTFATPLGYAHCRFAADGELTELQLSGLDTVIATQEPRIEPGQPEAFLALQHQLAEYFEGRRREFDLPLAPRGTEFQRRVWAELAKIPYGETITYAELAVRTGNPRAVRAVGSANSANPIWIIIPCHRVIGSDGSLTGYAGGIAVKHRLLELEGAITPQLFEPD